MSTTYQGHSITTLHRLTQDNLASLEHQLNQRSLTKPIGLILPALVDELYGNALPKIIDTLSQISFIKDIVLVLGNAKEADVHACQQLFSSLTTNTQVIWDDSPELIAYYTNIGQLYPAALNKGKGRSVWLAMGFLLAKQETQYFAFHDCDILTYDKELLIRLCYPLLAQSNDFQFCKGFYARFTHQLHGRVTRLLVTPLLHAVAHLFPESDYCQHMHHFFYPCAGEFAFGVSFAKDLIVPSHWGLEIAVLTAAITQLNIDTICQADLCERFDHKHQPFNHQDETTGILKMAHELTRYYFSLLQHPDLKLDSAKLKTLSHRYAQLANTYINRYAADAEYNGFYFDKDLERNAVSVFAEVVAQAQTNHSSQPSEQRDLPSWQVLEKTDKTIFTKLLRAVDKQI